MEKLRETLDRITYGKTIWKNRYDSYIVNDLLSPINYKSLIYL